MNRPEIVLDDAENKVVLIPNIFFMNKQNIDWKKVESSVYENNAKTDTYNVYSGWLVVNCTSSGKKYLYDLVDIKKEASNPFKAYK